MKSPKTKQKPARQKRIKSIKPGKSRLSPRKKKAESPVKIRQFLVSRNNSKVLVLDILKSKPVALVLPKEEKSQYIVPNYSHGLRNFFFKTTPAVLMVFLLSINFAGAKRTFAVFNDSDSLLANSLAAGTLEFSVNSGGELLFDLKPGESQKKDIIITNNGTLNFQYNVVVENVSDNGNLCDKIQSSVDLNGSPVYSGSLMNFTSGDIVFTPNEQRWTFNVSLPSESDNLENKTCQFKFVFNGRQDNLPSGFGFSDTQNIQSNFQANYCDHSNGNDHNPHYKHKGDEDDNDEKNEGDCEHHNNHNGGGGHKEDGDENEENNKHDSENTGENLILSSTITQQEEASSTTEKQAEPEQSSIPNEPTSSTEETKTPPTDNQPPTETAEQPPQPPLETFGTSETPTDTPVDNTAGV
ncbi:MAG: hypothetical protein NUV83_02260 [Candidatus Wolfebacteria bacterium]|nr:hypothetical protein [Candidatus Wolfebacteria bacterium]